MSAPLEWLALGPEILARQVETVVAHALGFRLSRKSFRSDHAMAHVVVRRDGIAAQQGDTELNEARAIVFGLMRNRSYNGALA